MADWLPIATAPRDGTMVDLTDGATVAEGCYWTLCDRGWSVMGVMAWAFAAEDMAGRWTHWRPAGERRTA